MTWTPSFSVKQYYDYPDSRAKLFSTDMMDLETRLKNYTDLLGAYVDSSIGGIPGPSAGSIAPADFNLGAVSGTQVVDHTSNKYFSVVRCTLVTATPLVLNFTNVPVLASGIIIAQQALTGTATSITLQQSGATTTIKWDGGTAHAMSTALGAIDLIAWQKSGVNVYCNTAGKAYA
jgi:hypothetical protein